MSGKYDHTKVETKWQERWKKQKLYVADIDSGKEPFFNLWMFPYPSAEGLHAGHAFASTGSDIYGRYQRMRGKNVFQPIGYDSFGIHSENYAIKINQNPQDVVKRTTKHYEEQMRSLGHGYDWTRTVTTSDPLYYKWTQWLFAEMFKAGLAYKRKASVNFCPSCKTVLADEQVMSPKAAGKEPKNAKGEVVPETADMKVCERCGTISEKRELDQWFMRITDYADRLLEGLEKIDWSDRVVKAQREWIGKKEGINIIYDVADSREKITVFTTRPDTNFGATFIVVAPESEIIQKITTKEHRKEVEEYIKKTKSKSNEERVAEGRKKTGAFTGSYAVNQLNGYKMPIWISDFVLSGFGTGAVVGVPGHDKRDFEFAKEFGIPVTRVVVGSNGEKGEIDKISQVQEEEGTMINSGFLDGLEIHEATLKIMDYLVEKGWGKRVSTYHLRDWLVSRQRYWGAPIPMIHCKNCEEKGQGYLNLDTGVGDARGGAPKPGSPLVGGFGADERQDPRLLHKDHSDWDYFGWWPEENLPVILPPMKEYKPEGTGKGPLSHHPEFYEIKCPHCGSPAERETDVMDTFVDSSWYFLRYPSVRAKTSTKLPFDPVISKKWLPVNLYFGGAEHSVLHLMYSRFVNMVLHDKSLLDHNEPFPRFFAHGLMIKDGAKMSKSRGNVVNPDEYVAKFGADTLRMYLMFMGPMDGSPDFRDTGIEGMQRFLNRLWKLFIGVSKEKKQSGSEAGVNSQIHKTIKGVTQDLEEFKYNTALAKIMQLVNFYYEHKVNAEEYLKPLALLLAPFAPHMTEEVWVEYLHQPGSIHTSSWPSYESKYIQENEVTIIVQVNGKVRSQLVVDSPRAANKSEVEKLALSDEKVKKWLGGSKPKKSVFVPTKLINFVV